MSTASTAQTLKSMAKDMGFGEVLEVFRYIDDKMDDVHQKKQAHNNWLYAQKLRVLIMRICTFA